MPDNYTDIFDDGTASFVLPKGRSLTELGESVNLTSKDILEIYSTGKVGKIWFGFPIQAQKCRSDFCAPEQKVYRT